MMTKWWTTVTIRKQGGRSVRRDGRIWISAGVAKLPFGRDWSSSRFGRLAKSSSNTRSGRVRVRMAVRATIFRRRRRRQSEDVTERPRASGKTTVNERRVRRENGRGFRTVAQNNKMTAGCGHAADDGKNKATGGKKKFNKANKQKQLAADSERHWRVEIRGYWRLLQGSLSFSNASMAVVHCAYARPRSVSPTERRSGVGKSRIRSAPTPRLVPWLCAVVSCGPRTNRSLLSVRHFSSAARGASTAEGVLNFEYLIIDFDNFFLKNQLQYFCRGIWTRLL